MTQALGANFFIGVNQMIRILKISGEVNDEVYIVAIGETYASTINRYDKDVLIQFLCKPHEMLYEYKSIAEADIDPDDLETMDAFEVLEVYGNPEINYSDMLECFELIWNNY